MDLLLEIRDDARRAGVHLGINGDLRHPSTDEKGIFHLGGLALPSRGRTADFAKLADLVALMVRRPEARPAGLYGARYLVGHDPVAYHGRDRHHVAPTDGPANLGELLRGAGYWIPRHDLMEPWAEDLIAWGATLIASAAEADRGEAQGRILTSLRRARKRLAATYNDDLGLLDAHLVWAWQDTLDRAEIMLWHDARQEAILAGGGWTLTAARATRSASIDDE
jgi:hypothetical protein